MTLKQLVRLIKALKEKSHTLEDAIKIFKRIAKPKNN